MGQLLQQYLAHMTSRFGGNKSQNSAEKARQYLETFLASVGELKLCAGHGTSNNVEYCLNSFRDANAIARSFDTEIADNLKKPQEDRSRKSPGTYRARLSNIGLFLEYIVTLPAVNSHPNATYELMLLRNHMSLISKSLEPEIRKRRLQRRLKESKNPVTAEDFVAFEQSKYVIHRIQQANRLSSRSKKSLNNFKQKRNHVTGIRNVIITVLQLRTAQRTGTFRNMTLEEVSNAEKSVHGKEEWYTVSVEKHKTMDVYGPAKIYLEKKYFAALRSYIDHLRPVSASPYVFVTSAGEQLSQSYASQVATSVWNASGVGKVKSFTHIRKAVVKHVKTHCPALARRLAAMMNHRESTRDEHYDDLMSENVLDTAVELRNSVWNCGEKNRGHNDQVLKIFTLLTSNKVKGDGNNSMLWSRIFFSLIQL